MDEAFIFFPAAHLTTETVVLELARFKAWLTLHEAKKMVLDAAQILSCDTAGIAFFIETKRLCALKKNDIQIRNMSRTMRDLAIFSGVEPLLLGVMTA